MSIREFLLERIAEDEATLERNGPFPHSTHGRDLVGTYRADCPDCIGVPSRERVLAECEAKRAVIEEHWPGEGHYRDYCETCAEWWHAEVGEGPPGVRFPCPTLRAVAAVYKDHPDYQQEWAIGQHP